MSKNTNICPQCMGAKEYFVNKKDLKSCDLCDDNGLVNDEIENLYVQESLIMDEF